MPLPCRTFIRLTARLVTIAMLSIGAGVATSAHPTNVQANASVHPQKPGILDYLPYVSGGYMLINMEKITASQRFQTVMADIERESGETLADHNLDKLRTIYTGFDAPEPDSAWASPAGVRSFSVLIGKIDYSTEVVNKAILSGATSSPLSGRTVYTSGTTVMTPLDQFVVLKAHTKTDMQRMFDAAALNPATSSALQSVAFQHSHRLCGAHMVTVIVESEPILTCLLPELEKSDGATFYKSGIDALRSMTFLTMTLDWDTHPVVHITFHLPARQHASVLADTLNGLLNILRNRVAEHPTYARVLAQLRARTTEEGVVLKLEIPAELADPWLDKLFKEFVEKRNAGTLFQRAPESAQ